MIGVKILDDLWHVCVVANRRVDLRCVDSGSVEIICTKPCLHTKSPGWRANFP